MRSRWLIWPPRTAHFFCGRLSPQLPEALRLIEAWGFRYKSVAFVWLKKNKKADSWFYGLGFWTRGNAEICLLATRGHPKRQAANIHQFIISPIEAHSKKPDEAREKIVALMGDLPRVELFARQSPPGWEVWGETRWQKAPSRTLGQIVPEVDGVPERRLIHALCECTQRPVKSKNQNGPKPYQAPAHLFWLCGGGRHPVLSAGPGLYRQYRGHVPYAGRDAPGVSSGHV